MGGVQQGLPRPCPPLIQPQGLPGGGYLLGWAPVRGVLQCLMCRVSKPLDKFHKKRVNFWTRTGKFHKAVCMVCCNAKKEAKWLKKQQKKQQQPKKQQSKKQQPKKLVCECGKMANRKPKYGGKCRICFFGNKTQGESDTSSSSGDSSSGSSSEDTETPTGTRNESEDVVKQLMRFLDDYGGRASVVKMDYFFQRQSTARELMQDDLIGFCERHARLSYVRDEDAPGGAWIYSRTAIEHVNRAHH